MNDQPEQLDEQLELDILENYLLTWDEWFRSLPATPYDDEEDE